MFYFLFHLSLFYSNSSEFFAFYWNFFANEPEFIYIYFKYWVEKHNTRLRNFLRSSTEWCTQKAILLSFLVKVCVNISDSWGELKTWALIFERITKTFCKNIPSMGAMKKICTFSRQSKIFRKVILETYFRMCRSFS